MKSKALSIPLTSAVYIEKCLEIEKVLQSQYILRDLIRSFFESCYIDSAFPKQHKLEIQVTPGFSFNSAVPIKLLY